MSTTATAVLRDVVEINPSLPVGCDPRPEDEVSFLPMAAVDADETVARDSDIRTFASVSKGYTPFVSGDILVAKITPCFENGKIAQALLSRKLAYGSTEFHVIRPTTAVDGRYLLHFLRQPWVRVAGARRMTGSAGQRRVPAHFLAELAFPLPSLREQRRIATILDKVDDLRSKRRAALAQLDTLTQSIFVDMFGEPSVNSRTWSVVSLVEVVDEFRYGTSNKSGSVGLPALRIPNVVGGVVDTAELKLVPVTDAELSRLALRDGDLLFVRSNGNPNAVGRCAVFEQRAVALTGLDPETFVFASYLIRARPNSDLVAPEYLRDFMLGPDGRRQLRAIAKTSAGQFNINTEGLAAIRLPLPPMALQAEYCRRIAVAESCRATYLSGRQAQDELFTSLQHRAFRGEL